jgi:D-glycero-D-manno-heptose 1,7-bisphosphate phosphatase
MKIAMFDLDGTLRLSKSGQTFINDPYDQKPLLANWNKAMILKSQGWQIVGITNQGGVHAGHKSLQACMVEQLHSLHMLRLDLLMFCPDKGHLGWEIDPYNPKDGIFRHTCLRAPMFRKPAPGMLLRALATITKDESIMSGHKVDKTHMNFKNFDNSKHTVFYCGDRDEDRMAAECINIRFIHAEDFANDKTTKGKLG